MLDASLEKYICWINSPSASIANFSAFLMQFGASYAIPWPHLGSGLKKCVFDYQSYQVVGYNEDDEPLSRAGRARECYPEGRLTVSRACAKL